MDNAVCIGERFRGPPNSGHGGYVSGMFAKHIANPAEITLLSPVPLEKAIAVKKEGEKTLFCDGDTLIGYGVPTDENVAALNPPTPEDFENSEFIPGIVEQAEFERCFVCGTGREDGLRLSFRKVKGKDYVVGYWTPDAEFADEAGYIKEEIIWAVLDCPGGWASIAKRPRVIVLGRIVGEIIGKVKAGEKCLVTAWQISESGRKSLSGTAIYSDSGRLIAKSKTLWIELKPDNPFVNDNSDALNKRIST